MAMDILQVNKIRTQEELESAFAIRRKVFVDEQGVDPKLEWDNEDVSTHFLALLDNQPCGACRYRKTEKGYKLERFAVLKEFRGRRVGQALVAAALDDIPDDSTIYLNAQVDAVSLYAKFGFSTIGEEFEEAGIKHYQMIKK
jgi:predicted GNAT family N-acyltransferase